MGFFNFLKNMIFQNNNHSISISTVKQILEEVQKLSYEISVTKDPSVFFNGYDVLINKAKSLAEIENHVKFTGNKPSVVINTALAMKEKETEEFLIRWDSKLYNEITHVKKMKTKRKKVNDYYDSIEPYYPFMSPANVDFVRRLKMGYIIDEDDEDEDTARLFKEIDDSLYKSSDLSYIKDGFEFETYVANLLLKNGFNKAEVTQKSGDYGADVLAEKDGVKYAIQCKLYSKPVGNKAVQEVFSAKQYYNCHVAVVATNNTFTNQAIELAKSTGTLLWDKKKLTDMES